MLDGTLKSDDLALQLNINEVELAKKWLKEYDKIFRLEFDNTVIELEAKMNKFPVNDASHLLFKAIIMMKIN